MHYLITRQTNFATLLIPLYLSENEVAVRNGWLKRKLQTVRFKGREPRSLLWKKKVYEEWFHYAKMAQKRKRKIPRAFGNLRKFDDFEAWWRDERHGFELFCERPMKELVSEITGKTPKLDPDEILIRVNLKGDLEVIERDFKKLLREKDTGEDYTSNARFQPSRPMQRIAIGTSDSDRGEIIEGRFVYPKRANKLRQYRETYLLAEQMSAKEVALKLGWLEGDKDYYLNEHPNPDGTKGLMKVEYQNLLDNRIKKVKRHVDQVEAIFENIAKGTFP